jgi:hypothetical protein
MGHWVNRSLGQWTVAVAAATLLSSSPAAQSARVSVQVFVASPDGAAVGDLTPAEFRVTSNGRPLRVESVSSTPGPATVVLLFDVSASVDFTFGRGSAADNLRKTIDEWLAAARPAGDRWQLGSFARRIRLGAGFTGSLDELRDAAREVLTVPDAERYGPSPVWDAVDAAVTALEPETGRRAVVVVTDGRSTGNQRGMGEVMTHALAAGVPVSIISNAANQAFPVGGAMLLLVQPEIGLQLIADETGGAYAPELPAGGLTQTTPGSEGAMLPPPPKDPGKLGSVLDRLLGEVRQSYVLSLSGVAADGQPHHLEVSIARVGAMARARKAYVAGAAR